MKIEEMSVEELRDYSIAIDERNRVRRLVFLPEEELQEKQQIDAELARREREEGGEK